MNYETMLGLILDLGAEMIRSGGETHRVEDTVYRLVDSCGYRNCNVWVVPSNIQATVTDPRGRVWTQIRQVRGSGVNFYILDQLNNLSRWACAQHPGEAEFAARLGEIRAIPPQKPWVHYLGGVLGAWGFGVFFGCGPLDSLTAALASLLVTFLVRRLSPKESNPLILNFSISLVTELFILLAARLGLGANTGAITIGVVMLLISGLGATNGLRDLVHLDTLSGLINLTASFTGAIGIALGFALPMFLLPAGGSSGAAGLHPSFLIQLIFGTVACIGFSFWFKVRNRNIFWCAVGAFLTWGVYYAAARFFQGVFFPTFAASIFCGLYGQILARVRKSPATIFTTIGILLLIPGSSLYYAMYGIVTRNTDFAYAKGVELGLTCFGIVLGFMVVEVANRFLWRHPH